MRDAPRLVASAVLAALGCAVAAYLAADQLGLVTRVWDPLFGSASSQLVLHSWLSRALPIPDALLGALGYLVELLLVGALWLRAGAPRHAWLSVGYGATAIAMALVGAALLGIQAVSLRRFCSLCVASAAISWLVAVLALPTVASGIRTLAARADRRGSA